MPSEWNSSGREAVDTGSNNAAAGVGDDFTLLDEQEGQRLNTASSLSVYKTPRTSLSENEEDVEVSFKSAAAETSAISSSGRVPPKEEKPLSLNEKTDDDDEDGGDKETNKRQPPPLEDGYRLPINPVWTKATACLRRTVTNLVIFFSVRAVRYPKRFVAFITVLSCALVVTGFLTNFRLELSIERSLTPVKSRPAQHSAWIHSPEGFPEETKIMQFILHNHGKNVLHVPQFKRVLKVIETVRTTPGYEELCLQGKYLDFETNQPTCRIISASGYFKNHNQTIFEQLVQTDEDLRRILSSTTLANGAPVFHDIILGKSVKNTTTGMIDSVQSYLLRVYIPSKESTKEVEKNILQRLDTLRRNWIEVDKDLLKLYYDNTTILEGEVGEQDDDNYLDRMLLSFEISSIYAYQLEILRSILGDLYLIPICCLLMITITCLYFYRSDNKNQGVQSSHMMLGIASVLTIVMSMMSGNGLMFIFGVPYGILNQLLPFVILGIGLDDTFIITNAYFHITAEAERLNKNTTIEQRMMATMEEIGSSISLTTITTVFAFFLGYLFSSLPGVQWLCLSAMTTIGIDFIYQITYFISLLVLDEERIQANRSCCCWMTEKPTNHNNILNGTNEEQDDSTDSDNNDVVEKQYDSIDNDSKDILNRDNGEQGDTNNIIAEPSLKEDKDKEDTTTMTIPVHHNNIFDGDNDKNLLLSHRIMRRYANFLLRPATKIVVLLLFSMFFGCCLYSCTKLEQEFDVSDWVRDDSYLKDVFTALHEYSSVVKTFGVYFRNIDQTNETIQQQMIDYVNQIEALEQIGYANTKNDASNGIDDSLSLTTTAAAAAAASTKLRPFCWVRDFKELERKYDNDPFVSAALSNMSFIDKLDFALNDKIVREIYAQDIVRDEITGNITASRCTLFITNIDLKSVEEQMKMLADQRKITRHQPINNINEYNKDNWAFFAFDDIFFYWEAYTVAVQELISTIIVGIVAVSFITFIFIPHWTAVFITFSMILILYVELLGLFQFFGLHIDGLTYVCVVVAIGLLIDFIIHILLRYYECSPTNNKTRDERVKETLETMGVSIMIGGFTTFMGMLPVSISSLNIFMSVFYACFSMVVLGITHGLILLPVILSLIGPTVSVIDGSHNKQQYF